MSVLTLQMSHPADRCELVAPLAEAIVAQRSLTISIVALNSTKQPPQSFASARVLLACTLFGFVHSHHANSANEPRHMNFTQKSELEQNDDDSWYTSRQSPGFHEDFGS